MVTKKIIKIELELEVEEPNEKEGIEKGGFSIESVKVNGEALDHEGSMCERVWIIYDDENGHDVHLNEGNY